MTTFDKKPFTQSFGTIISGQSGESILNLDQQLLLNLFESTHFLFFTNFSVDTSTFTTFTDQFSENFIGYAGGAYTRQTIGGHETLLSVTGNTLYSVPAHGEMYYMEKRPDLIWFYCASPAKKGGETTVYDAIKVYEALSDDAKTLLHAKRLKYIRHYPDGFWQKIFRADTLDEVSAICQENCLSLTINADRSITTEYTRSAFVQSPQGDHWLFLNNILPVIAIERLGLQYNLLRLEDGSTIPDTVLDEIASVTERLAVPIPWQKGNIAMIDNRRLLHGRRPFEDDQREIYVRMASLKPVSLVC